jgi:hypothetical protein
MGYPNWTGFHWLVGIREAGWGPVCLNILLRFHSLTFSRNSTFYDGKRFISRLGNPFTPPQWFLDSWSSEFFYADSSTECFAPELPKDITLVGELYGGRREFQSTVSIVKTVNSPHWQNITFQVHDWQPTIFDQDDT